MKRLIEVDVDGVLLDIHSALENKLHEMGFTKFSMENVRTYDFNRSLGSSAFILPTLGVTSDIIFNQLKNVEIFRKAKPDWDAIEFIKHIAANDDIEFIIHTSSLDETVTEEKKKQLSEWFGNCKNISFVVTGSDKELLRDDIAAVIENCHLNLYKYPQTTQCYLVNKPYNRLSSFYNTEYMDILNASHVHRCENTLQALKKACNTVE